MKFKESSKAQINKIREFLIGKPQEFKNVQVYVRTNYYPTDKAVDIEYGIVLDGIKLDTNKIEVKAIYYDLSGYSKWEGEAEIKDENESSLNTKFYWKGRAWAAYNPKRKILAIADTKSKLEKMIKKKIWWW